MDSANIETVPKSKIATVLRVTSGNFLEMFDFFLFGFYATYISKAFFPTGNEFASLMLTFMTFGAGFLMRPLGAIFLGAYVDRVGRRQGLIVTLDHGDGHRPDRLRAGLCDDRPARAHPGAHWTPAAGLLGRRRARRRLRLPLRDGHPGPQGLLRRPGNPAASRSRSSSPPSSATCSTRRLRRPIRRLGLAHPILHRLPDRPVPVLIRRSLERRRHSCTPASAATPEVFALARRELRIVLLGMLLVAMTTISFYPITVYTPTFGKTVLKLSDTDSLLVTFCVGVSNFLWLPVMGALSDRIGRRRSC